MSDELKIGQSTLRLVRGDITDYPAEAFVYYARHDLALGSGYGTAIAVRGGTAIQEELKALGPLETTRAVMTSGGKMKARHIIHAVGPRFQEEGLEPKLRQTVLSCLRLAEEKGIRHLVFPPMGAGFYGVPLPLSAEVTLGTIIDYLSGKTGIERVDVCLLDNREYKPYRERLQLVARA